MYPDAAASPLATRSSAVGDVRVRRSSRVGGGRGAGVVGGTGLGARHSPDDVADRAHVVVEVRPRAHLHRRALLTDLLQALGGNRLQRASDDRKTVQ